MNNSTNGDLISRVDAIKCCGFGMTSLLIADCLRRLPPVTPEHTNFEHKAGVVIAQLREDRDRLLDVIAKITEEINSSNRGTCDYEIIDNIEEIINDYKALDKDDSIEDLEI